MPQTPLVDKMFNLTVDSGKKKMKSSKLLFGEEQAIHQAINESLQNQQSNIQASVPYKSDDEEQNHQIKQQKPPPKREISSRRKANLKKQ